MTEENQRGKTQGIGREGDPWSVSSALHNGVEVRAIGREACINFAALARDVCLAGGPPGAQDLVARDPAIETKAECHVVAVDIDALLRSEDLVRMIPKGAAVLLVVRPEIQPARLAEARDRIGDRASWCMAQVTQLTRTIGSGCPAVSGSKWSTLSNAIGTAVEFREDLWPGLSEMSRGRFLTMGVQSGMPGEDGCILSHPERVTFRQPRKGPCALEKGLVFTLLTQPVQEEKLDAALDQISQAAPVPVQVITAPWPFSDQGLAWTMSLKVESWRVDQADA